ncbi:MAG TPA: hypothetical protein VMT89_09550, partial [Candidatus Acidoferrales bacterium]|nr:hypothetical protein [Candidatus Acidoferrales bacterium]
MRVVNEECSAPAVQTIMGNEASRIMPLLAGVLFLLGISVAAHAIDTCPQVDLGSPLHATVVGTTVGGPQSLLGTCGGGNAPEATYSYTAPSTGDYIFDTDDKASTLFNTVLYVLDGDCSGLELACNDDIGGAGQQRSRVRVGLTKGQHVIIVVDGAGQSGSFILHVNRADVSVDAGFVVARPGDVVPFAVTLNAGGAAVADVDHTLSFDSNNAPITSSSGAPDCQLGAGLNKEASSFSFLPDGCNGAGCIAVRARITSALNHDAIPDGATLYTCTVSVPAQALPGTYPLAVADVTLNDTDGAVIPGTVGGNGEVLVRLARCGNGVVEEGEDCDDGGLCIGGSNAGSVCLGDGDCNGGGACDGGSRVGTACSSDSDCPGGRCGRCKTFGGDGCAANCTSERDIPYNLIPGVVNDFRISPGTSGAQFLSSVFNVPLPLQGNQTLTIGKAGSDGSLPFVLRADSVNLPKVSALDLSCACIRAVALKTCGGTLFDIDGTASQSCTPGFMNAVECPADKLCAFVHGPGNAATGILGCGDAGVRGIDFNLTQDAFACTDAMCSSRGPGPVHETITGNGPRGSARLISSTAIGVVSGPCQESFCTADDPLDVRGIPITVPLTTGRARGTVLNTGGIEGFNIGPVETRGSEVDCEAALQDTPDLSGFAIVAAFPLLDDRVIGDAVVSTQFVAQGAPPTSTPTETASVTATPSETTIPSDTPTETETPSPTATPSNTEVPTETATELPSETPTSLPSETPTSTATEVPTLTVTPLPTNTAEPSLTPSPLPSETPTLTATVESTATPTMAPTATRTMMPPCVGDCDGSGEVTIDEL